MSRNEQTKCSMGPTVAQQDRAMARLLARKAEPGPRSIKPILDKVIQQYLDDQGGIFCPIATSRADDFLSMLRRAGLTVKALKK